MIFFALDTLVDPPLAPTMRGLAGPPVARSDHWYGGDRNKKPKKTFSTLVDCG